MDALLGQRVKNGTRARRAPFGQAILFIIDEEERLILTVEQARDSDWTTNLAAWLVQKNALLRGLLRYRIRRKVTIIEPVVCVECGVAMIPIETTMILV
jgi:hypothetical protein